MLSWTRSLPLVLAGLPGPIAGTLPSAAPRQELVADGTGARARARFAHADLDGDGRADVIRIAGESLSVVPSTRGTGRWELVEDGVLDAVPLTGSGRAGRIVSLTRSGLTTWTWSADRFRAESLRLAFGPRSGPGRLLPVEGSGGRLVALAVADPEHGVVRPMVVAPDASGARAWSLPPVAGLPPGASLELRLVPLPGEALPRVVVRHGETTRSAHMLGDVGLAGGGGTLAAGSPFLMTSMDVLLDEVYVGFEASESLHADLELRLGAFDAVGRPFARPGLLLAASFDFDPHLAAPCLTFSLGSEVVLGPKEFFYVTLRSAPLAGGSLVTDHYAEAPEPTFSGLLSGLEGETVLLPAVPACGPRCDPGNCSGTGNLVDDGLLGLPGPLPMVP